MSYFYKLCLKSISSHSESFWKKKFWVKNGGYPNTQPFFSDFINLGNIYKCFDLSGQMSGETYLSPLALFLKIL